jgi:hypothetical protein
MRHDHDSAHPPRSGTPNTDARALAAELLGVAPIRARRRAILTTRGLAAVDVLDRFTEIAIDLHWAEIADVLAGKPPDRLAEIRGFKLDGHQLAFAADQIPSAADLAEREVR